MSEAGMHELRCEECKYFDEQRERCGNEASMEHGKPAGWPYRYGCEDWDGDLDEAPAVVVDEKLLIHESAASLTANVQQMGQYILQLGQLIGSMQRRMDEMERQQAAVTVRHEDVKRLQALIRMRAEEICGKYELTDRDSPRIFRAAIKKDVLKRAGVKDLHDVPAAMLGSAENLVDSWTSIRMIMERRGQA